MLLGSETAANGQVILADHVPTNQDGILPPAASIYHQFTKQYCTIVATKSSLMVKWSSPATLVCIFQQNQASEALPAIIGRVIMVSVLREKKYLVRCLT